MDNDAALRRQLDAALQECLELREELGRLRQILLAPVSMLLSGGG
ncbi:MAG: hypothetical protein U0Q16_06505 [Bryobacteraceae bacterium]